MTIEQQIADILADRESGSSQLLVRTQRALQDLESSEPDLGRLRWALGELRGIDRSMVVVHHLLDSLEPAVGPSFFEVLRAYEQHWAGLPPRVAAQLVQARSWCNSNVLVHSRSGMLLEAVKRVAQHYEGLSVWQTRSEPGGEGVAQLRDLQALNVAVSLVEDDQVGALAASMDAAWLGVDQYSESAFVNKVGSKVIAERVRSAGKITYVLGDPRKQVDTLRFSSDLFEAVPLSPGTCLITGDEQGR